MNKIIIALIFLLAGLPLLSPAQNNKPGAKAPMAYQAFFKNDMRKTEGVFPVYRDKQKCYVEIPASALGRDLLVSGSVTQGEYYGAVSSVTSILAFELGEKNELVVRQQICADRAKGELAKAVEAAGMQPVKFSYPIAAYGPDKNSYIIDITADVNASGKLFSFPNVSQVNKPAADRSGLDSVYVIRDGVKFISLRAQTDVIPGFMFIPPRDKHTSVLVEWTLQLLPERQVAARESDPRIGYATISFNDYDRNPNGVARVRQIQRWNLEVRPEDTDRYNRGELVEPANPIRVYLDRTLSSAAERRAVSRAVAEWNACFEAAGFKNALQIQEGEPEAAMAYHQLVFSYVMGREVFSQVSDPRTGEILCGRIALSNQELNDNLDLIAMSVGGYNPAFLTDSMPAVREEYIRYRMSNQTGLMLGLLPNLAASSAFTTEQLRDAEWIRKNGISASVTDGCATNFAAQPGDGMTLSDLFAKASLYDRWAIEWGYRQYPGMDAKAEKEALSHLAAKAKDKPALFYAAATSGDYRINGTDSDKIEADLGNNKLETATLGLKNMERLAPQLPEIFEKTHRADAPWTDFVGLMAQYNSLYQNYLSGVMNDLGGVAVAPVLREYNDKALTYLPRKQGQETMAFLNRYLFQGAPEWRTVPLEEDVIGLVGESKSAGVIMNVCRGLMGKNTLARLLTPQENGITGTYTLTDLFNDVDRYVFLNYSTTQRVDRFRALLQYNMVREFMLTYSNTKAAQGEDPLSFFLVNKAKEMEKKLERLSKTHSDAASRVYYRGLSIFLTRSLNKGSVSSLLTK